MNAAIRYSASLFLFSIGSLTLALPPEAPSHLRVNDVVAPTGTCGNPYFGWHVNDPDPDEIQTRYQIRVASSTTKLSSDSPDIWDSKPVTDTSQNHVTYTGSALKAEHPYYWQVRTWDKDGSVSPWSAPSTFGVGLLTNGDWSGAYWIRRESKDEDDYTYFRKQVTLPTVPIIRATAYVSAAHQYELFINGTLAGEGQAYHHPQYQYYRAFDVTSQLHAGQLNQLAVFTHWFGGGQGRPAGDRGLLLKLIAHHADGSTSTVGTDESWKQSRATAWVLDNLTHRNRGEGVGYVEHIDARLLITDWNTLAFDDSLWDKATAVGPHPTAPWTGPLTPDLTRIRKTLIVPNSVTEKSEGKYVIDLGKVQAGMPRIHLSGGSPGSIVTMRGGYVLNEHGEIPPNTLFQSTLMEYKTTLDGNVFTYAPIEYLGFRYFQIDNAPMPVTSENFQFIVRHSELDSEASDFESSDSTLNAVWHLMKHSIFTCAHEAFVDTPTREKGGFLGDAAIQSTVAMPVLGERKLTQRTLREFLQSMEQHWADPKDRGRMNAVYPNNDGGRDIPDYTQAYLTWVWNYYLETGDRAFLISAYPRLNEIGEYVYRHTDPNTGLVTRLTGGSGPYEFGIIDWPPTMRYGYDTTTVARTVVNGWAYCDYVVLAQIAGELQRPEDEQRWNIRATAVRTAINSQLVGPDGTYIDGLTADGTPVAHSSQHANMFPLALGFVPSDHRATVIEHVSSMGMRVGMVTVSWLVRALGECDQGSALLDLFTRADQPGWAQTLARGATATWESWESDTNGDSLSHAWGAAGLEGYVRYVLGIRPLSPQYDSVLIQPLDFDGRLSWAKGKVTTDRGEIAVNWKWAPNGHVLRVSIPVNVTATIALPTGKAPDPIVLLDGKPARTQHVGDYLHIAGVGSGEHVMSRCDDTSQKPLPNTDKFSQ